MSASNKDRKLENIIPVLPVKDIQRSIQFYTQTLDFELAWGGGDGETLGAVAKDGFNIYLSEDANSNGGMCIWIGMEDDSLFALYQSRGVKVLQEPQNRPWAYEMKIADPDGNVLWLGTGPKE